MTRKQLITVIRVAAFENDTRTLVRLYCENRISRQAFNEAVEQGRKIAEAKATQENTK